MATLAQTRPSGNKFEEQLVGIIGSYTHAVWRNVRVETLLTKQGTTEIDILFCFKDTVFIVEAKNVSSIMGDYGDTSWSFIGAASPTRESKEYTKLNVITQNNIHVKSFKELFYASYGEWPSVLSCIVVPNDCRVSPDIAGSIYTVSRFDAMLTEVSTWNVEAKVQRRVAALITGDGYTIRRPDFHLTK